MSSMMWRLPACTCVMPVSAMAQCGAMPCHTASRHPLDWFNQLNGMGGANTLTCRRQQAVSDDSGNRIEYALDSPGNSTGQAVKDPNGSLRRNMARVMDALSRAREISGRE